MQHAFTVTGMSCQHCVRASRKPSAPSTPDATVRVDLDAQRVEIESSRPRTELAQAIRDEGYTVID
jgi:copper chaperone